jgi:hypothetical protein
VLPPGVEILTKLVPFQYFVCLHKSAVLLHEQLKNRENPTHGIPRYTMRQYPRTCPSCQWVCKRAWFLTCHAICTSRVGVLKPAIQIRCWEEREIWTREAYFDGPWSAQCWELGVMIGLILLENISIFQIFYLYAKYVPRFIGITPSLKQKIGISQLYIHGVIW